MLANPPQTALAKSFQCIPTKEARLRQIAGTRKPDSEPGLANSHGLFWIQVQWSVFHRAHMSIPQPKPRAIIKLLFDAGGMRCSLRSRKLYSWLEIQLHVNKDKTPKLLAVHSWCSSKWGSKIRNAHGRVLLGVFSTQCFPSFHGLPSYSWNCSILSHHSAKQHVHCLYTAFVIPNSLSKELIG